MTTDIKEEVKQRYGEAAQRPAPELCCPTDYDRQALKRFIPDEVLGISYGCGTPAGVTLIRPQETVLDIGSGGGIDCFIASKQVGPGGRVIGIDMTDEMLEVARRNAPLVSSRLGYPRVNTEFRKGEAEAMPLEDTSVDLIISNCVINLSPDKSTVFSEMWRVLRPGGRFAISDILTDEEVPQYLRGDKEKWGDCVSGALSARKYLAGLWQSGFRGLAQEKHFTWKRIDGLHFLSVTLTGYKPEPGTGEGPCYATLKGPFSSVTDEEGRYFERGRPVRIPSEKAHLFSLPAYQRFFLSGARAQELGEKDPGFSRVLAAREPCFWRGDYALLVGPFREAEDDDGHRYHFGEPVEICSKTVDVLNHEAYGRLFCIFNRAGQSAQEAGPGAACAPESGTSCC